MPINDPRGRTPPDTYPGEPFAPTAIVPADPTPRQQSDLIRFALEHKAGIDIVERLAALEERRDAIEAKKNWAERVADFKAEVPPVIKRGEVNKKDGGLLYKFASYDSIKAVTVPFERKHGIVTGFTFEMTTAGNMLGKLRVTVGSHTEEFTFGVPIPKGVNTNTTQEFGMAQTYLKRYLYVAAFDLVIAGEDSDAVGLFEKITPDQVGRIHEFTEEFDKLKIPHNHKTFLRMYGVPEDGNTGDIPPDQFDTVVRFLQVKLPVGHRLNPKPEAK